MNRWSIALSMLVCLPVAAQLPDAATQLTIYNDNFAVARTTVPLDLHAGSNEVLTTNVTSQLEPDSVILRDASGKHPIRVAEQNYDAGVVTQPWMLEKYEGKTIDFQVTGQLPGLPIFPATTDGLLLKPTLRWQIDSEKPAKFDAELDYLTNGMSWQATYNIVVPEQTVGTGPELADVTGWVTIQNNSGTDFPKATIQLMAGDVAKIREDRFRGGGLEQYAALSEMRAAPVAVSQKAFDDFHLYDLHRTVALRNGESKQVQFLEAANVAVQRSYQFDGSNGQPVNFYPGYHDINRGLGNAANTKVAIREEITNSEANHLGMPLPSGRLRLYRQEKDGQMQFVGESMVQHTPADQTVQVVSGNAFDLTAARRQTDFHVDNNAHTMDETIEVKLSNAKGQPVTIHDVEHLNRSQNWDITEKSSDFVKRDSNTIDYPIVVPAKGSTTLTYSVRYTW